ncbi:MAG: hypothetical protein QQN63_01205, partial [Nitrosopumilus sp.]
MTTVSYDFEGTEDFGDFVTPQRGRYLFKFVKADATQKSNAGHPKVIIDLAIVDGQHDGYVDGIVRQHYPSTGKGAGRLR